MEEREDWKIREGAGLVLPLHGDLISFEQETVDNLSELEAEIALAHLKVAKRLVKRRLILQRAKGDW